MHDVTGSSLRPHGPRSVHLFSAVLVAMFVFAAGCGSSDDDVSSAPTAEPTATEVPLDLPERPGDLGQVCTTGDGFADLPAYDAAQPGPHLIRVELENQSGSFSFPDFEPREWGIGSSSLGDAALVGCGRIVEQTTNGTTCSLTTNDGRAVQLQLVDVVYEVEIVTASTAEPVGSFELSGSGSECPASLNNFDGQTEYLNVLLLDIDQAAAAEALAPFVTP